jgi:hypothetical protein
LKKLFEECGHWTQGVKQRNGGGGIPARSALAQPKPIISRNTTLDTKVPDRSNEPIERDFTTPGTPSALRCPFQRPKDSATISTTDQATLETPASSQSKKQAPSYPRSKRTSFNDPIRAELCGYDPLPSAALTEGSAACPIRFLDQHSPEELAKYFEKHKHELPRSHEVCVKRYQRDSDSVRHLDAKYGNLAAMIQGLGEKHQHWLPDQPTDDEDEAEYDANDHTSSTKVQQWADEVAAVQKEDPNGLASPSAEDEHRQSHFDRPVKEVRVGESPSRPWGVSVPAKYFEAPVTPAATQSPTPPKTDSAKPAGKCPFDHLAMRAKKPDRSTEPNVTTESQPQAEKPPQPIIISSPSHADGQEKNGDNNKSTARPQMIFNGPVFIGYPTEDVIALLQKATGSNQT